MYLEIENKYGKASEEIIEKHKKWIKEKIKFLLDEVKKDKNYLKIFFQADIKEYKKESENTLYLISIIVLSII